MNTETKPLAASTVKGLLAIAAAVLANPEGYDQNEFFKECSIGPCGCLAFHHTQLTQNPVTLKRRVTLHRKWTSKPYEGMGSHPFYKAAIRDLKLTEPQGEALFMTPGWWPDKFRHAYNTAKGPKARARVAERRIKHFIKTNGAE